MLREGFPKGATFENHEEPGASPPAHKTGEGRAHTQTEMTEQRGGTGARWSDGQETSPGRKTATGGSDGLPICVLQRTYKSSYGDLDSSGKLRVH